MSIYNICFHILSFICSSQHLSKLFANVLIIPILMWGNWDSVKQLLAQVYTVGRAGTQTPRLSHCFPWWLCYIVSVGTDVPHGIWKTTRTLFLHSLFLQIPCMDNSRGRIWLIDVKLEMHTGPKCCRHGVSRSSGIWNLEKNKIYQKGGTGQWLQTLVKEHYIFWK